MRKAVAALAAVLLVAALAGCDDDREAPIIPGPGPSKVRVDTPELRTLKARIGMEDCVPGPGGGALPAITLPCLGGGAGGRPLEPAGAAGAEPVAGRLCAVPEEMPALQAFDDQYGDRVPVLGVDFADQYPGSALEEAGQRGVTYPSLADPGGDLMDTDSSRRSPACRRCTSSTPTGASRTCGPAASTPKKRSSTWSASTSR